MITDVHVNRNEWVTLDLTLQCLSHIDFYRQTANVSHTKYQHLNVSRLLLQLSLPNPVKPSVKSRMKM